MNDVVDNERLTFDQTSWYMNASSNMNLGNGFTMEVSGNYFSPSLAGAVVWSDFNSLNFGLQKSFDDGGRLSFNVTDILLGGNWRGEIDNPEINFQYRGGYTVAERIFRLSYSNRFGNTKLKQSRNRETGAAETLRRDN